MFFMCELNEDNIKKSRKRFYLIGGLMTLLGIIALAMPLLVSFAIETLIGIILMVTALSQAIASYRGFADGDKPWQEVIMTIIAFVAGFIFLAKPMAGALTIAFLLSFYFFLEGIFKLLEYFALRKIYGSIWMLFSGIIALFLAFAMWNNLITAASMIGIVFGVNLLFGGISFLLIGYGCSKYKA